MGRRHLGESIAGQDVNKSIESSGFDEVMLVCFIFSLEILHSFFESSSHPPHSSPTLPNDSVPRLFPLPNPIPPPTSFPQRPFLSIITMSGPIRWTRLGVVVCMFFSPQHLFPPSLLITTALSFRTTLSHYLLYHPIAQSPFCPTTV